MHDPCLGFSISEQLVGLSLWIALSSLKSSPMFRSLGKYGACKYLQEKWFHRIRRTVLQPKQNWQLGCKISGCGCSAKAMGEALSSSSSQDRQARGSGDPLIEPLGFLSLFLFLSLSLSRTYLGARRVNRQVSAFT